MVAAGSRAACCSGSSLATGGPCSLEGAPPDASRSSIDPSGPQPGSDGRQARSSDVKPWSWPSPARGCMHLLDVGRGRSGRRRRSSSTRCPSGETPRCSRPAPSGSCSHPSAQNARSSTAIDRVDAHASQRRAGMVQRALGTARAPHRESTARPWRRSERVRALQAPGRRRVEHQVHQRPAAVLEAAEPTPAQQLLERLELRPHPARPAARTSRTRCAARRACCRSSHRRPRARAAPADQHHNRVARAMLRSRRRPSHRPTRPEDAEIASSAGRVSVGTEASRRPVTIRSARRRSAQVGDVVAPS